MAVSRVIDKESSQIDRLRRIIECLRGENGCPWDQKQTARSMTVYLVEEVYELIAAINEDDPAHVCEELGDVLFQLFFIASIYQKSGWFDLEKAAEISADKMVRRHPHVFGEKTAESEEAVKKRWHQIKKQEQPQAEEKKVSLMDSVPRGLPALLRAYRVTSRASRVGFDWENEDQVMDKAKEEMAELADAMGLGDTGRMSDEIGDVFFTFVNLARFLRIHPETALADAIGRFESRFRYMEKHLAGQQSTVEDADFETLDALWERAKRNTT